MTNDILVYEQIKVFISSRCGKTKYDDVRSKLKKKLEDTRLVKVYLFEKGFASTQSATQDYLYALDDSDVCIFLIDNYDDVTTAIVKEIGRAKSYPKKSLYIFCNENEKEPTQIQKELTGADGARYYVTSSFGEFIDIGFNSLMNDIIKIYKNYCKNRLIDREFHGVNKDTLERDESTFELLEKSVLKGIGKTKGYYLDVLYNGFKEDKKETSEFDSYCLDFVKVLFGEKNIREFNSFMFLNELKSLQSDNLYSVVHHRWEAIQNYWSNDFSKCIDSLNSALMEAKGCNLPEWILQDILIDIRNVTIECEQNRNRILIECEALKELNKYKSNIHYPIIDRYDKQLYNEINKQVRKSAAKSPYSVQLGSNISIYCEYLSSIIVTAIFYGSLTHILMTMNRLNDVAFNLCNEYSDWQFRKLLLKTSFRLRKHKDIKEIFSYFNDIYGKISNTDSSELYYYCESLPVKNHKNLAKLEVVKFLGYYFSDDDFNHINSELITITEEWLADENRLITLGDSILETFKRNYLRINNNRIALFCLGIFNRHLYRFYDKALEVICILDLDGIEKNVLENLFSHLREFISNQKIRDKLYNLNNALINIKNGIPAFSQELDELILENMPSFFHDIYKLETNIQNADECLSFIKKYINQIRERNISQGQEGKIIGYVSSPYTTIINIMKHENLVLDEIILEEIIEVTTETITESEQTADAKIDAIRLLIFLRNNSKINETVIFKYFQKIKNSHNIGLNDFSDIFAKQTSTTVRFNFLMLDLAFNSISYADLLEFLTNYEQFESFDKIEAINTIINFLEGNHLNSIDNNIYLILLQFVIAMTNDLNHDVRYHSIRALLLMIKSETKELIMTLLSKKLDYESSFIKKRIIDKFDYLKTIDTKTTKLMIQKVSVDSHYAISKIGMKHLQELDDTEVN